MKQLSVSVTIVIPTRNRTELAMNAIRSVLDQTESKIHLVVSDNSTDLAEVGALADYCVEIQDPKVIYVRPPEPLDMGSHWQWAMEQALKLFEDSHVLFLTDRIMFLAGGLSSLFRLAEAYPDYLISYIHDRVNDLVMPVRLEQSSWTGNVFEVRSEDMLRWVARCEPPTCLPRMLNCCVPRRTFEKIAERFGDVFRSIAPDMCFAFRYLELFESFLYYDKPLAVHYALARSNGQSQSRGILTKDHVDFLRTIRSSSLNYAAPIPNLNTVMNTIIHEYNVVKQATQSPRFPDVDKERYLEVIESEVGEIESDDLRRELSSILTKQRQSWRLPERSHPAKERFARLIVQAIRNGEFSLKVLRKLWSLAYSERPHFLWRLLRRLNITLPPIVLVTHFNTATEAIAYALPHRVRRSWVKEPFSFSSAVRILKKNHS